MLIRSLMWQMISQILKLTFNLADQHNLTAISVTSFLNSSIQLFWRLWLFGLRPIFITIVATIPQHGSIGFNLGFEVLVKSRVNQLDWRRLLKIVDFLDLFTAMPVMITLQCNGSYGNSFNSRPLVFIVYSSLHGCIEGAFAILGCAYSDAGHGISFIWGWLYIKITLQLNDVSELFER